MSTKKGPCDQVRAFKASSAEYDDWDVAQQTYLSVSYEYQGKQHQGTLVQEKHDDGREIKNGDELPILVNKKDHKKISSL